MGQMSIEAADRGDRPFDGGRYGGLPLGARPARRSGCEPVALTGYDIGDGVKIPGMRTGQSSDDLLLMLMAMTMLVIVCYAIVDAIVHRVRCRRRERFGATQAGFEV